MSGKGNDNFPIWSSDGKEVLFTSSRSGNYDLFRKQVGADEATLRSCGSSWGVGRGQENRGNNRVRGDLRSYAFRNDAQAEVGVRSRQGHWVLGTTAG